MSRTAVFRFLGRGDGGCASKKGHLVTAYHGTPSSGESPPRNPATNGLISDVPTGTASVVPREGVHIQIGGRTVLAVYVSPVIAAGASLLLGLAGWGYWPW